MKFLVFPSASKFSMCVKVVRVFHYGEMLVMMVGVKVRVLLEGCIGGCNGNVAGRGGGIVVVLGGDGDMIAWQWWKQY